VDKFQRNDDAAARRRECLDRRDLYVGLGQFASAVAMAAAPSIGPDDLCLRRALRVVPEHLDLPVDQATDRRALRKALTDGGRIETIRQRAQKAIMACAVLPPMGLAPEDLDARINVYLIADIGETFASAALLDVAAMLVKLLAGREHMITGVLTFAQYQSEPATEAAIYATLREVDCCRRGNWPGAPGQDPLNGCIVLSDGNDAGRLPDTTQRVVILARLLANFHLNDRLEHGNALAGKTPVPLYATAGLASARLPFEGLCVDCMTRWLDRICTDMLAKSPQATDPGEARRTIVLPSPETLKREIVGFLGPSARPTLDLPDPDFHRLSIAALAKTLRVRWQEYVNPLGSDLDRPEINRQIHETFLAPLHESLTEQIEQMIRRPYGLWRAVAILEALTSQARKQLDRAAKQADLERAALARAGNDLIGQFEQAAAANDAPPSSIMVPPWYHLLRWLAAKARIREAQGRVRNWFHRVTAELHLAWREAQTVLSCGWIRRACHDIHHVVAEKRQAVGELCSALKTAPQRCEDRWRGALPPTTVADRNILSHSEAEAFIAHTIAEHPMRPPADVLKEFLDEGIGPDALPGRLAELAEERFSDMDNTPLRDLLEAAGTDRNFTQVMDWITRDVWSYAEPLLRIQTSRADAANRISETAVLRPPDFAGLQAHETDWQHSSMPPEPADRMPHGALLCRITCGFELSEVPWLTTARAAYEKHDNPAGLHLLDCQNNLPDITADT